MDGYQATSIVLQRIQTIDPENASKIMGLLLIKDYGEKEMIRLAFGSESLINSVILQARKELRIPCSNNSPPTPSTLPSPSPNLLSRQNSTSSSRLSSGFSLPPSLTIPNPSWVQNHDDLLMSPNNLVVGSSTTSPFYSNGSSDPNDDFQLQDQLSFLNDGSDSYGWGGNSLHRRSCSVNDAAYLGSEDPNSGLGWKPCLYFARGYCKNGSSCRFLHGDSAAAIVGSPNKIEMMDQYHHELLRSKSSHQQRLAAATSQLMASNSFPYSPKDMNFLLQQQQNDTQRAAAAAVMMSEELQKFGRSRLERNDFSLHSPTGMINPASRQIYLTFPADSTFREEDVSEYFSKFGPVQDVRIPYQQKRMFGFVTFVFPETVKDILSKGNPHFVCDARVLVKPYKEKGKVLDKKQLQHQVDREFSPCGTPTGLVDARDQYDLQLAARMFYNSQDMLWRRKLEEQAELQQQALEIQRRRLMGLQLLDIPKQHQRALSTGSPIPSPTQSPNMFKNLVLPSFRRSSESPEENGSSSALASTGASFSAGQQSVSGYVGKEVVVNGENGSSEGNGIGKQSSNHDEEFDLQECLDLEHNLPDSPFASPTKAAGDLVGSFSNGPYEVIDSDASANSKFGTSKLLATSGSSLEMGPFKPFNNCQLPRFSSGHGTIGMFAGTGGPIGI